MLLLAHDAEGQAVTPRGAGGRQSHLGDLSAPSAHGHGLRHRETFDRKACFAGTPHHVDEERGQ